MSQWTDKLLHYTQVNILVITILRLEVLKGRLSCHYYCHHWHHHYHFHHMPGSLLPVDLAAGSFGFESFEFKWWQLLDSLPKLLP